jgi:hypothetical protein
MIAGILGLVAFVLWVLDPIFPGRGLDKASGRVSLGFAACWIAQLFGWL